MKQGWTYKKLGEVATIIGGSTPKTSVEEYWGGTHYWVTPANLDGNKYQGATPRTITDLAVQKTNLQLLPIGTVLLSSRAPIGKVAITTVPMYCNQGFKNIVCSDLLINEFVYWYLYGKVDYLNSLGTGATFKEISKKTTEQIPIPVPSIAEQQRIVDYLNAAFTQIDELKSNAERQLAEVRALFQSALTQAMQPKPGWQEKKLKEICRVINGRAYAKHEMLDEGKYRLLRVGNFFTNNQWFYSDLELEEDKYCDFGDLLYAWSASFGPRIWDGEKVIYHYHIWKMICSQEIDKFFLFYWLDSNMLKSQTMTNLHGTTMAHITKSIIENSIVVFPSIPIQKEIASNLDCISRRVKELEEISRKTAAECDALKQALLRQIFE